MSFILVLGSCKLYYFYFVLINNYHTLYDGILSALKDGFRVRRARKDSPNPRRIPYHICLVDYQSP